MNKIIVTALSSVVAITSLSSLNAPSQIDYKATTFKHTSSARNAEVSPTITIQMPSIIQGCLTTLQEIAELENNWNGNNAPAFSKNLIDYCKTLVRSLSRIPEIFPVATGAIQFEYDNPNGDYLGFSITEHNIHLFMMDAKNKSTHKDIPLDNNTINTINEEVERFYGEHTNI